MTTKTITITNDAYDLAGAWADMSDEDANAIKKTIETIRKESKSRILEN